MDGNAVFKETVLNHCHCWVVMSMDESTKQWHGGNSHEVTSSGVEDS